MKQTLIFFIFLICALGAQAEEPALLHIPTPGDGRIDYAKGYYYTEIDGEEVKMIVLNEVVVYPELKFKNKKQVS